MLSTNNRWPRRPLRAFAWLSAALLLVSGASAQDPAGATGKQGTDEAAAPATTSASQPEDEAGDGDAKKLDLQERAARRRKRGRTAVPKPQSKFQNPHGASKPGPQVIPARDVPHGTVEVHLSAKGVSSLRDREVTLTVTRQSIEEGNATTLVTARTDARGVAKFEDLGTETDFLYRVSVTEGPATYATPDFQFRPGLDAGMLVAIPVYPATSDLGSLVLLSRGIIAFTPQEDHFVVEVRWRFENFSDVSWVPESVLFPLPPGFEALEVEETKDPGFERDEAGARLTGTVPPGKHDVGFRFHMPHDGKSEQALPFFTALNVGSLQIYLSGSPNMSMKIDEFPKATESRNRKGQRLLVISRDFLSERVRAPEEIVVKIAGIPTPPIGRNVAVVLAFVIAAGGLTQAFRSRRSSRSARAELSREDLDRASELLLGELTELEKAFQDGGVGRRLYDRTRRQLLEAFARLGAERQQRAS